MEKKTQLIKQLILHQRGLNPSSTEGLPNNLDAVPMLSIWDRPEATILNIIQTYNIGKKSRKTEADIILQLKIIDENFSSSDNSDKNIVAYICHRLKNDYPLLAKYYDHNFIEYCFAFIAYQTGYPHYLAR